MTSNLVCQRLSAKLYWNQSLQIRQNYRTRWKLSLAHNVWASEDQNTGSQLASDGTHCRDTRRKFPQNWLIRRWLKQLTSQAPVHLSVEPTLKLPNEDRYCNDPTLPLKLSERCLYFRCEEKLAPLRFVPRTPSCSSLVILPDWCNETKSEDTSHWEWRTKHAKNWTHTGDGDNTDQMKILTKNPLREHVKFTLTWITNTVNCDQSWYTSSKLPPSSSTSMRAGTLVIIPRLGSTAPVSLTMMSSKKGTPCLSRPENPHYSLPPSLYFSRTHDIPVIVQHFPA